MAKAPAFPDAPRLLAEALYALNTQVPVGLADSLGRAWLFGIDTGPPAICLRLQVTVYGDEDGPLAFSRAIGCDVLGADDTRDATLSSALASLHAEARAPGPSLSEGRPPHGRPPTTPELPGP